MFFFKKQDEESQPLATSEGVSQTKNTKPELPLSPLVRLSSWLTAISAGVVGPLIL